MGPVGWTLLGKDPSLWSLEPKRRQLPVPGCCPTALILGISAHVLEGLEWVPEMGCRGAESTEALAATFYLDLSHS